MRTASRPAFLAPPTATVATGIPAGICTIDSSESSPSRCARGTGTPITGSGVTDASMPGRCAAPPAPAMMTRSPRPAAADPYPTISRGHTVGGHHVGLVGDAELVQGVRGRAHHRPVRIAAHDDAHQRLASHDLIASVPSAASSRGPRHSPSSVPQRRKLAARRARSRSPETSSPSTVTWPILRPGRIGLAQRPGLGLHLQGLRVCYDVYLHSPLAWNRSARAFETRPVGGRPAG